MAGVQNTRKKSPKCKLTINVVIAHPLATGSAAVGDRDAARAGNDDGESVEAHVAHAPCSVSVHAPRQWRLTARKSVVLNK
jgi:hypothetical protein